MDIPEIEPAQLRAGTNWSWKISLAEFPAPTWTVKYWLKNATDHLEITASASGSDHLVSVLAATTAPYAAGLYDWVRTAEAGSDRHETGSGRFEVLARVDNLGVLDARSTARKILEQLEAAFLAYSTNGQGQVQSYSIGDRSMTFHMAADFIKQIEYWRGQVALEDAAVSVAQGLGNPRRFFVRFG